MQRKSIANVKWQVAGPIVHKYIQKNIKTYVPRIYNLYGEKNWALYQNKLFLFGREVVYTKDRKHAIIDHEEEQFGGEGKAFGRIQHKYIGISRADVEKLFRGSERRQLKARYQKQKSNATFIHSGKPGHLQIDLTFYRAAKLPVFGAVDVFSRYAFYARVPDKRASSVAVVLKKCVEDFEKISNFKVYRVSTDSGVEFQREFKNYLMKRNIVYDRQVRSRKLIESLNRSLRVYVERSGWDLIKDLDELVQKFVKSYNESVHSSTKKTPNELVRISEADVDAVQKTQKRGKLAKLDRLKEGFVMAKLNIGDRVRLYDPRRLEIKAKQKQELKGKIKLSEKDYVKRFTSHHRGQAPHWSKKIYVIERKLVGKIVDRYLLVDKAGAFFRHELKKVALVTKKDPHAAKKALRKEAKQRYEAKKVPAARRAKYVGKVYKIHYSDEPEVRKSDIAVILEVYKNYMIVFHFSESGEVSFCDKRELRANQNRGRPLKGWKDLLKQEADRVEKAKAEIDETIQELKDENYEED